MLLDHVPDFSNWDKAYQWIEEGKKISGEIDKDANFASLEWSDITEEPDSVFGLYRSKIGENLF